jgi:ubiquinone/menaquinone biosynthesis C-methylase UbiE
MTLAEKTSGADDRIFTPRRGYDIAAPHYESWYWFKFWRLNEAPIVRHWLKSLKPGLGLDAGSGIGTYIPDILEFWHRCVAVDISAGMLRISKSKAELHTNGSRTRYIQADISRLPFGESVFDWVLCSRVLSHIENVEYVLREFARVLRSGGECLISDVHPEHPYTRVAIPTGPKKIAIETYKHPLEEMESIVASHQFRLVSLDEYYLDDLREKPPITTFEKLYRHPDNAVFYVLRLMKI